MDGSFMYVLVHLGLSNVARRWNRSLRIQPVDTPSRRPSRFTLLTGSAARQLFKDTVARHSYKVGVLAAWAGLLERDQYHREDVDPGRLLHMALLHDVVESQTGTFDHQLKQLILPDIRRIEDLLGNDLIRRLPEPLQPEFRQWMLSLHDGSVESQLLGALDDLEAALKCRREVRYGNECYFRDQMEALTASLRQSEFMSVRAILTDIETDGDLAQLWDAIERLDQEPRWEGKINFLEDDDAGHSWRTAVIAVILASMDRHLYGADVDLQEIARRGLFHDLHEAFIGDIRTPVKHMDTQIHEAINHVEDRVNHILLSLLPHRIRRCFKAAICAPKDGSAGEYIAMADSLDALFKCAMEVRYGNEAAYRHTFEQMQDKIQRQFPQPVMRDTLAYILPEFLRTAESEGTA